MRGTDRTYHWRGILILLCLLPVGRTILAQSCRELHDRASWNYGQSNYRAASQDFVAVRECYLRDGEYPAYFSAFLMQLDCLEKLSQYEAFSETLASYYEALQQYSPLLNPKDQRAYAFPWHVFEALRNAWRGDLETALGILIPMKDSLADIQRPVRDDSLRLFKVLVYASECHLRQGEYELASGEANRAVSIALEQRHVTQDGAILRALLSLSEAQFESGQIDACWESIGFLQKLIGLMASRQTERMIFVSQTVFSIYLQLHRLDSAYAFLNRLQHLDTLRQYQAEILLLTGDYDAAAGDLQKAKINYQASLNHIRRQEGTNHAASAQVYLRLGQLAVAGHRLDEAIQSFHNGLCALSENGQQYEDPQLNPALTSLYPQRLTLQMLEGKSRALLERFTLTGHDADLELAWRTAQLAVSFTEFLRNEYSGEADKSILINDSYPAFECALDIVSVKLRRTTESMWVDTAFALMERSKALNLRDAILHDQARRFAGIPDSLVEQEYSLRTSIASQERTLYELSLSPNPDDNQMISVRNSLDEFRVGLRNLLAIYEREHPKYYALRHQAPNISLDAFMQSLDEHEILLEYFTGEQSIYLLWADVQGAHLVRCCDRTRLTALVNAYRTTLLDFPANRDLKVLEELNQVSHELLDLLIPASLGKGHSLLIIPDGILGYISFAGLLTTLPHSIEEINTYDFLVRSHDLIYCYSANLYQELRERALDDGPALLCAPEFDASSGFAALAFNRAESEQVNQIVQGDILAGKGCTRAVFESELSNRPYRILHLATHASADDIHGEYSFLAFSDGKTHPLYARDLYNLDLEMDLVYLSACETGTGELRRGEGMISLARGFFYAGVRSLVTTLWRVEDARSAELARRFYGHLAAGMTKGAALASAQREYLSSLSREDRGYAHPVYWSALIAVGNPESVRFVPVHDVPYWMLLSAGGIALLILWWTGKRFLSGKWRIR